MEYKNGKMALDMLESGAMTKLMAMENSYIWMETYMKDIGLMIWHMEEVDILMLMALCMMETGFRINKKGTELSTGQMVQNTKDNSKMD